MFRIYVVSCLIYGIAALSGGSPLSAEEAQPSLVGRQIEEFSLKDYRGRAHALSEYAKSDVVVLAFLGTECPLAKLYGPRLAAIDDAFESQSVTILGVNSNRHDSITEIAAHARVHGIEFPVLKDLGNRVADQVGAKRTPEIVVLDRDRIVRYHGRIDDQYGVGYIRDEPQKHFLKDAITALLAGRKIAQPRTDVVGCFIGRVREPQANSEVTWSNQIVRVLQKHCVECHREGEIAPFSLTSYEDVVGWGDTMVEVIRDQRMPPWHANPEHGHFSNARLMTDAEKGLITRWVAAGSPEGDPQQLPEPRQYVAGWQLPTKPDVVIGMRDQPFDVPAEGTVRYQYFQVDPGFTEDKWIAGAEAHPGNRAVVHHILVFVQPPSGRNRGFSGTTGQFLAAYVPGHRAPVYPPGTAKLIPAGSRLVFQMHYTPIGTAQKDLSQLGLVFADPKSVKKVVTTQQAVGRRLSIPPHAENHRVETRSSAAPVDVEVLAFMPHMHLRGKSFRYEARYPDGRSEILLDVPRYDFNWQTAYRVTNPVRIPKGAYIHCVAHFDNSEHNLNNPDPTQTVGWGDQTLNEMMIGYFDVAIPASALGIKPGSSSESDGAVTVDGKQVGVAGILKAIAELDRNKNRKLEKSEVPEKHMPLFKRLDRNEDGVLTRDEARESIRKWRESRGK